MLKRFFQRVSRIRKYWAVLLNVLDEQPTSFRMPPYQMGDHAYLHNVSIFFSQGNGVEMGTYGTAVGCNVSRCGGSGFNFEVTPDQLVDVGPVQQTCGGLGEGTEPE
jgi:hypothetical protein